MRRRMLQALDGLFRNYVPFFAVVWVVGIPVHFVVLVVLLPWARGSLWYGLAAWTVGCSICVVLVGILKALFHGRVVRALGYQRGLRA